MLVLSSPSGAGKTTTARAVLAEEVDIEMSVSATTRQMRPGEQDGIDYRFVTAAHFAEMVSEHAFLEHANVFDHRYGTPKAPVMETLAEGRDVLFDIDWQGTQQVREAARDDLVSVFILPPSIEELERRLRNRAQDSEETIRYRMSRALDEMSHWSEYDYVIVNEDQAKTIGQVRSILAAERHRRERQIGLFDFVTTLRGER